MTSSDREILIAIKGELQTISRRVTDLESTTAVIRKDISDIKQEQIMMRHDMESLQHSVYWIFAAIGIFLAAVAVIPSLTARKPEAPKDDKIHLTLSQFGTLITDRLLESRKGDSK